MPFSIKNLDIQIKSRFYQTFIIIFFSLIFVPYTTVAQSTVIAPFTGADILMLVDQSGSMGGAQYGQVGLDASDPTGMRFDAQQFILDYTSDLDYHTLDSGRVRMSVVGFGDPELLTIMTWTEIATDGLSFDEFVDRKANISQILSADFFGFRNFGFTDFYDAFLEGQKLFEQLDPLPPDERNIRIVILITDGEPCLADDVNCGTVSSGLAQLSRLQSLTSTAFPSTDYAMYMIALQNDATGSYMNEYQADWERILLNPDHLAVVEDRAGLYSSLVEFIRDGFEDITRSFKSRDIDLLNGQATVNVPPYVKIARFNILKLFPDVNDTLNVTLTDPNGNSYAKNDPRIQVTTDTVNIETWSVSQPVPGDWTVDFLPTGIEVELSYDQASVLSNLEDPPTPVYQWQSLPIATRLFFQDDVGDIPISILPEYPLDVVADVYLPTFEKISLPLLPTDVVPQYVAEFHPLTAGEYGVGVIANISGTFATTIEPDLRNLIDTNTAGDIETVVVNPVRTNVVFDDLLFAQGNDWVQIEPFNICLQLLDRDTSAILKTGFDILRPQIEIQDDAGNVIQIVDLLPGDQADCTFQASFEFLAAGQLNLYLRGYMPDVQDPTLDVEVFERVSAETFVNVFDLSTVTVTIVKPDLPVVSEDSREGTPLFNARPLVLEIETTIDQNGTPVLFDLEQFVMSSSFANVPFSVNATHDGTPLAINWTPQRIGQGKYRVEEFDLDDGIYDISVTGERVDTFACRCQYVNSSNIDSVTITRSLPVSMILFGIGGVLFIAFLLFIIYYMYRTYKRLRVNPLSGVFVILFEPVDGEILEYKRIDLNNLKVNTTTFSGRELRLDHLGVAKVKMTNNGSDTLHAAGKIRIEFEINKNNRPIPAQTVTPNASYLSLTIDAKTGDQYFISLENDELL